MNHWAKFVDDQTDIVVIDDETKEDLPITAIIYNSDGVLEIRVNIEQ